MIDLKSAQLEMSEDLDAVNAWCSDLYDSTFSIHFVDARHLFERLKSRDAPITDDELNQILIDLPLNLFDVSEKLNSLRLNQEVVKLKNRQKEADLVKASTESTATKRQESASLQMISDKLLITAYSTVISRVEGEISFCRELIMGAKKIWDARRRTEQVNPVNEVTVDASPNLPAYTNKSYIKGGN